MIRSFTVVFIAVIIVCIAENLENTEYKIYLLYNISIFRII